MGGPPPGLLPPPQRRAEESSLRQSRSSDGPGDPGLQQLEPLQQNPTCPLSNICNFRPQAFTHSLIAKAKKNIRINAPLNTNLPSSHDTEEPDHQSSAII
ncbi:hypothetical protein ATANTOWER_018882 [Ataeniobius toweri]|uniref:Uncharacterized protein n=1 Tax=Ataeniobius toweri TaxID=208326 RepID=A0ABU7C2P1_9TELE|nr:hypothetical protein [Ataeniobius toweri]